MVQKTRKKIDPLVIERQDVIAEVRISGFEIVRLSRVKYEGNDYTFTDIRVFRRGWDGDEEVFHPSKKGLHLKEGDFLKLVEPYLDAAGTPFKRSGNVH